jgi:hypothetical protein
MAAPKHDGKSYHALGLPLFAQGVHSEGGSQPDIHPSSLGFNSHITFFSFFCTIPSEDGTINDKDYISMRKLN